MSRFAPERLADDGCPIRLVASSRLQEQVERIINQVTRPWAKRRKAAQDGNRRGHLASCLPKSVGQDLAVQPMRARGRSICAWRMKPRRSITAKDAALNFNAKATTSDNAATFCAKDSAPPPASVA